MAGYGYEVWIGNRLPGRNEPVFFAPLLDEDRIPVGTPNEPEGDLDFTQFPDSVRVSVRLVCAMDDSGEHYLKPGDFEVIQNIPVAVRPTGSAM